MNNLVYENVQKWQITQVLNDILYSENIYESYSDKLMTIVPD